MLPIAKVTAPVRVGSETNSAPHCFVEEAPAGTRVEDDSGGRTGRWGTPPPVVRPADYCAALS